MEKEGELRGKLRGKLGRLLEDITAGKIQTLDDLGILPNPRFVLFHGPLRLLVGDEWLNLGKLRRPCRLSELDIAQASEIETTARRCLTIENETSFHELAKLHSSELLVCTSYPGSATLTLLRKLPAFLEFWHFGDSDPEGFDILRDLRERTGRQFRSLHMHWRQVVGGLALDANSRKLVNRLLRSTVMYPEHEQLRKMLAADNKGRFEQESLGIPTLTKWPFYSE